MAVCLLRKLPDWVSIKIKTQYQDDEAPTVRLLEGGQLRQETKEERLHAHQGSEVEKLKFFFSKYLKLT